MAFRCLECGRLLADDAGLAAHAAACATRPAPPDVAARRRRCDEIILAAAREELHWDADDPRHHDHAAWKRKLLRQLWEELRVDFDTYT